MGIAESFSILLFNCHSDHCCISLKLKVNYSSENLKPLVAASKENIYTDKYKFTFEKDRKDLVIKNFRNEVCTAKLSELFDKTDITQSDIDGKISDLNEAFANAAKKYFLFKRHTNNKKYRKKGKT